MPAASGKPTRARSAGLLGGDCGPGPAERGDCGSVRPNVVARLALHSCNLFTHTRELFVGARDLFVGVRESFIGARRSGHLVVQLLSKWVWSSLAIPFSVQCHPKVAVDYPSGRTAANTPCSPAKERPYNRRIWGHMAIASWYRQATAGDAAERRALSTSVPFSRQEAHAIRGPSQVA